MDINKLLSADYLDIIFEGRNKAYGGYELRRKYGLRSRRAGMLVIAGAAVLSAIPTLASMMGKPASVLPRLDTTIIAIAPPPELPRKDIVAPPPPPPPPSLNPPPAIAMAEPRVTPDNDVTETPATQEEMKEARVGLETTFGTGDPNLETGLGRPGGLPGGKNEETGMVASRDPIRVVEQMPEFNGSLGDWLGSHLRYPERSREAGEEGRSIVEFIVNEDGSIEAARIVRSSFPALDAEALRVVNAMPKWKAGRQNGKHVRVFFTLPISFTLD